VLVGGACGAPTRGAPARPDDTQLPPAGATEQAVVVFEADLREGPGRGAALGSVAADLVVLAGRRANGWREVEVRGDLAVTGWVREERLGCRALRDVPLVPLAGDAPAAHLRAGALLAVGAARDGRLEVETQGPIAVRGTVAAVDCGVGRRFFPTLPRDGVAHVLAKASTLVTDLAGGTTFALPEGHRFAVVSRDGRDVVGRTDGPVVVRGRVDARAVVRDKTTPFDVLAERMGYSHEVVLEAAISASNAGASSFAKLPGGTPLLLLESDGDVTKVRTHGLVRLEGWVPTDQIRRVALDHNELEPGARRRNHDPVGRDAPRDPDAAAASDD
jgi:hypothetical protein